MTTNEQLEDQIPTPKRRYFSRHWHGELSLAKSYWINLWFLSIVFTFVLVFWMTLSINENPVFYSRTTLIIIAVIYLIIYPWQIIGLWRSATNTTEKTGKTFWPRIVKFLVIMSVLGSLTSEMQDKEWYKQLYYDAFILSKAKNYDVSVKKSIITINGDFDYGISDKVAKILKNDQSIKFIILNSDGGLLYEANKLSKLILLNSLNTHTNDGCRSACTIAYISGNTRYIYKDADLGFHQYTIARPNARVDKSTLLDLLNDQQKNAKFFQKRGASKAFTDQMYKYDADGMWYPPIHDLKRYGVVHKILE
ncbi:MAG: hypothetical protein HOE35_02095 [Candidatus Ruthia sp.]|nr:hypothetical protein [Candidatus Ruthturnera sp.]